MKMLDLLFAALLFSDLRAQTSDPILLTVYPDDTGMPSKELIAFFASIDYPVEAKTKGIAGTVYLQLVTEASGKVDSVKMVKSSGNAILDSAALAYANSLDDMKTLKNWEPSYQNGKPVRVKYFIPIRFVLDDETPAKKE